MDFKLIAVFMFVLCGLVSLSFGVPARKGAGLTFTPVLSSVGFSKSIGDDDGDGDTYVCQEAA